MIRPIAWLPALLIATGAFAQEPAPPAEPKEEAKPKEYRVVCETDETLVMTIVAPNTIVRKGEFLAELDSAGFRDQLTNQVIATERAKAKVEEARRDLEAAELAHQEYLEGIYPMTVQKLDGERKIAEVELELAKVRAEKARASNADPTELRGYEIDQMRAELAIRQAEGARKNLEEFEKPRRTKELNAKLEGARAALLAAESFAKLEEAKEARRRKMIEQSKLYAPADGRVLTARDRSRPVEEGDTVRKGQVLMRIVPVVLPNPTPTPDPAAAPPR